MVKGDLDRAIEIAQAWQENLLTLLQIYSKQHGNGGLLNSQRKSVSQAVDKYRQIQDWKLSIPMNQKKPFR